MIGHMSESLTIVPFEPAYAHRIETWSSHNAASMLLKQPGINSPAALGQVHSWVALSGDDPIAVATIHYDSDHIGHLDVMVKPTERRRGVGGELVEYTLNQPDVKDIRRIKARVEHDNIAAQKMLSRQGFSRVGDTDDGRLEFEKH
jgi:ribosomal protein S18 acetylase RimI-like enzyme